MKVFLDMVGCRLNQSEIEGYARQFRLAGHSLTSDPKLADLIVINTCTVTAAAASDSRQKIRQAGRTGANKIIVTGERRQPVPTQNDKAEVTPWQRLAVLIKMV